MNKLTAPTNNIGETLTLWDGTAYDKYGVQHIITDKSSQVHEYGALKGYRRVYTAVINKDGKIGQRGMDFFVTDNGSICPVNAFWYTQGDYSYHSTFYRIDKMRFEIIKEKLGRA